MTKGRFEGIYSASTSVIFFLTILFMDIILLTFMFLIHNTFKLTQKCRMNLNQL